MKKVIIILTSFIVSFSQIHSGPMLGHVTQDEVTIWVQMEDEASVKIEYMSENKGTETRSEKEKAKQKDAYVVKFTLRFLEHGQTYTYKILSDDEVVSKGSFKTLPRYFSWKNTPDFRVGFGSCFIVNDDRLEQKQFQTGEHYEILEEVVIAKPDLFLWLGDNIYLRNREWDSRSGIANRYTVNRSHKNLQTMLKSMHHYATWDDHDYGPNDSDGSFHLKEESRDLFELFWANPTTGMNDQGIYTKFSWYDVDFFMLDNRWFKDANRRVTGPKSYFGDQQLNWLMNGLKSSQARFKIIVTGGQIVNPLKNFENYAIFEEERSQFLEMLDAEKIGGVIILSGDRHHSEISKMNRDGAYPLYDITISPITAKVYPRDEYEKNPYRLQKDPLVTHNFGIIDFKTIGEDRLLMIKAIDYRGKVQFEHSIKASELEYK